MLPYLRLARGYRSADLLRWLLTAVAAATVTALLLRALGRALTDPAGSGASVDRLLWCLPALAALGYLSAGWARSLPLQRPERMAGLVAAGAGPVRLRLLLAGETALACAFGALLALAGFLVLRAHWLELLPGTRLDPALGTSTGLPAAGTTTLLATVPLLGGLAAAAAVRPADLLPSDGADRPQPRPTVPYLAVALALPLAGAAMLSAGLHAGGSLAIWTGWLVGFVGIAVTVPALLYAAGWLLAVGRPRAVRLLAGRGLQADAWRLGTPLAVFAVCAALGAVVLVRLADEHGSAGTPALIETVLLAGCVLGALVTRLAELVTSRRAAYASLRRMGAAGSVYLRSWALRTGAAVVVLLGAGAGAAALTAAALLR
ncbi:hypothetical protein ACEZCY_35145 [Streptacidiphilus sp. N1-12]|uniref:Uncharacterized protein n=2 Tax=Streptacidiphilus alkalitolerans TaxID=3342712 RepID=A0ABV6VLF7_9ACTN